MSEVPLHSTGNFWQGLLRMFAERGVNGCSHVFTTATHSDVRTALGRANARVKRLRGEPDEVTPPYLSSSVLRSSLELSDTQSL